MSHNIPESLINSLKNKNLIPFIGAGVSMSIQDKQGNKIFPSWKGLLERASEELKKENEDKFATAIDAMINLGDYKFAADYVKKGLIGSLWSDFFKRNFDVDMNKIDDESLTLARSIWKLGNRIVTTNYDEVMHIACEDKNILVIDSSQKQELRDFHNSNSNKPKIFHLHGRVRNTSSIIFTTEDYDKLYKSDDGFYRSSITALRDLFKYNQVVFIGYSLDDIDLLITIAKQHDLFEENTGPHYILVQRNEESKIRNKISNIPIEIIIFENFGPPLIALIDNICDEAFEEKNLN